MSPWSYEVRAITLANYDDVPGALQEELASMAADGLELVSCFPAVEHFGGGLPQVPLTSEGSKPYDDVWNTPAGPTFVAILKRESA